MELALAVIGIVITILVAAFPWWSGEAVRIRQAVRDGEPDITFHVGSYGGAGSGYSLNIENRGQATAFDLQAFLPDLPLPAWSSERLVGHERLSPQVPLAAHARLRRELVPDATASVEFKDRLGLQHRITLSLTQTRRDDGAYSLGSGGAATVLRPTVGFREIWRLRRRV